MRYQLFGLFIYYPKMDRTGSVTARTYRLNQFMANWVQEPASKLLIGYLRNFVL
jgi:hypothetical protein